MKKIYAIVLATVLLCGCDSFLDVTPIGKLIPSKVQDFDAVSYTHLTMPTKA